MSAFSIDVILTCAYGINLSTINNPDHQVVQNLHKIMGVEFNLTRIISMIFPKLARWMKLNAFDMNATGFIFEMIEEVIKQRNQLNEQSNGGTGSV